MKCPTRVLLTVIALTSAGAAGADAAFASGPASREDENGDGVVSLEEARAAAVRVFERLDVDHDGVLTRDEVRAARRAPSRAQLEARFAELDRDRDGRLAPWESRLGPRRFSHADTDHDGRLSPSELARTVQARPKQASALAPLFWRRDFDHDGRVTRTEVLQAAELRFRRRQGNGHAAHSLAASDAPATRAGTRGEASSRLGCACP